MTSESPQPRKRRLETVVGPGNVTRDTQGETYKGDKSRSTCLGELDDWEKVAVVCSMDKFPILGVLSYCQDDT